MSPYEEGASEIFFEKELILKKYIKVDQDWKNKFLKIKKYPIIHFVDLENGIWAEIEERRSDDDLVTSLMWQHIGAVDIRRIMIWVEGGK